MDGTGESENRGHTQKEMEKEQQLSRCIENETPETRQRDEAEVYLCVDSSV